MAATSSSPKNLVDLLRKDHPDLDFISDDIFFYSPPDTVHFIANHPDKNLLILHELGHALLEHVDYNLDIELLQMEVQAWEKAHELANHYKIKFNSDLLESQLDSYRDWLYTRSACPNCAMTGYQTPDRIYRCPTCLTRWKARINRIRL